MAQNREEQADHSQPASTALLAQQLIRDYTDSIIRLREQTPTGSSHDINPHALADIIGRAPWFPLNVARFNPRASWSVPEQELELTRQALEIAPLVAEVYADLFFQAFEQLLPVQFSEELISNGTINPELLHANIPGEFDAVIESRIRDNYNMWTGMTPSIGSTIMRARAARAASVFITHATRARSRARHWNFPSFIASSTLRSQIHLSTLPGLPTQNPQGLPLSVIEIFDDVISLLDYPVLGRHIAPMTPTRRVERSERWDILAYLLVRRNSAIQLSPEENAMISNLIADENTYRNRHARLRSMLTPVRRLTGAFNDEPDIDDLTSVTDTHIDDFIL